MKDELINMTRAGIEPMTSRRRAAMCSGGHRFNSCWGLRYFFVPCLCQVNDFIFHKLTVFKIIKNWNSMPNNFCNRYRYFTYALAIYINKAAITIENFNTLTTCLLRTVWLFIYLRQNSQMYILRSRWNSSG